MKMIFFIYLTKKGYKFCYIWNHSCQAAWNICRRKYEWTLETKMVQICQIFWRALFLLHVQFIRIHVNIFFCHLKGNVVSICTSNFSIFGGEKDFVQDFSPLNIRCRFFRQVWQWFYKCLMIIKGFFILVYLSVAIIYVYIYDSQCWLFFVPPFLKH